MGRIKKAVDRSSGRPKTVLLHRDVHPQKVESKLDGGFQILTIEPKRKKADDIQNLVTRSRRLYSEVVKGPGKVRDHERKESENNEARTTGSKRGRENDQSFEPRKRKKASVVSPGASTMNQTKDSKTDEKEFTDKLNQCFVIVPGNAKEFLSFYECCSRFMYRDPGRGNEIRKKVESVMKEFQDFYEQELVNGRGSTEIIIYATTLALEVNIILVKCEPHGLKTACFPERHFFPRTLFVARAGNGIFQFLRPKFYLDSFYKLNRNLNDPRIFLELGKKKRNEGENVEPNDAQSKSGFRAKLQVESGGSKRIPAGTEPNDKIKGGSASGSKNEQLSGQVVQQRKDNAPINSGLRSLQQVVKQVDEESENKRRGSGNDNIRTSKRKRIGHGTLQLPKESTTPKSEETCFSDKMERKDAPVSGDKLDSCETSGDVDRIASGSGDRYNPVEIDEWVEKRKTNYGFNCPHCVQSFSKPETRDNHICRFHSSDRPFKCTVCGANYETKKYLRDHKSRVHKSSKKRPGGEEKVTNSYTSGSDDRVTADTVLDEWAEKRKKDYGFHCPHCVHSFRNVETRDYHIQRLHSIDRPYKCTECGANFRTTKALKYHKSRSHNVNRLGKDVKVVHETTSGSGDQVSADTEQDKWAGKRKTNKGFNCPQCVQTFSKIQSRDNHVRRLHSIYRPHKCALCGANFPTTTDLSAHKSMQHPENRKLTVRIKIPSKATSGSEGWAANRKISKGFDCPQCIRSFTTEIVRNNHVREMHGVDRPYKCSTCGANFKTKQIRASHISNSHYQKMLKCDRKGCEHLQFKSSGALNWHIRQTHRAKHICSICKQIFNSIGKLQRHRYSHKDELWECNICPGKTFRSRSDLGMHYATCHSVKKFKCAMCPNTEFSTLARYGSHMKTMHPDVPGKFQCIHCDKTFHVKLHLYAHKMYHHGKDVICPECDTEFAGPFQLRDHVNRVHGDGNVHKCEEDQLCKKTFPSNYRLQRHIKSVHEDRLFVCEYCESGFAYKHQLSYHLKYVHTTHRNFHCVSGNCKNVYKTKIHLNAHIKSAHKELQYDCDFCDETFQNNTASWLHLINVHGLERVVKKRYPCHLCYPEPSFPTNASWNLHRIVHHSKSLAPKDPKTLNEVSTCSRNKVFVSGDTFQYFLDNSSGTCQACQTKFYNKKSEESHLKNYHTSISVKPGQFHEKVVECQNATNSDDRNKAFNNLYKLSRETFHIADKRRKVYDLLFLPEDIEEDKIEEYVKSDKGEFYIYSGRVSMGFARNKFISSHHTTNVNTVATNLFAKMAEQGDIKYAAYLINEKYIDIPNDSGVGLDQEKKEEAVDILTLFVFAKVYNRTDVFFQKLEVDELEKLSLDEIDEVFQDVVQSNGNILNLRRFELSMRKRIVINTNGVDMGKYTFLKCPKCPEETPASISRFHSVRHHVTSHEKLAESVTEKLIVMKNEEFVAPGVYNLLRKCTGESGYWIYLAVGVDEKVKNTEEAFRKATSGYVGQCRNNPVAKYHFADNDKMSGLKLLKDRFKFVYLVRSWRLPEASEMDRGEAALIVKGSFIFRKRSKNPKGLTLVNKFFPFYAISNMFEEEEWQTFAAGSGSTCFDAQLPDFIKAEDVCDEVVDLTDLIPTRPSAGSLSDSSDDEEKQ